jgi:amidohydrolase
MAARFIVDVQGVISREKDPTEFGVVTVGAIHGGVRNNIIPDSVEMIGTIRSLDAEQRADIHRRIKQTAESIAASAGARADVKIEIGYPIVDNNPKLTERAAPIFSRLSPDSKVTNAVLGAEDFSFFQQKVPGLFFWVGTRPKNQTPEQAASNHSPLFYVDESGLVVGVRALAALAADYLLR